MTTIPITLWQSELQAHRERRLGFLVRLAEKCDYCLGSGLVHPQFAMTPSTCPTCNGTGYTNPLGEAGGVLMYSYTPPPCRQVVDIRLTRTDEPRFVRLQEVPGYAWGEITPSRKADWNRNNPDAPWSSNPVVVVGGVK